MNLELSISDTLDYIECTHRKSYDYYSKDISDCDGHKHK